MKLNCRCFHSRVKYLSTKQLFLKRGEKFNPHWHITRGICIHNWTCHGLTLWHGNRTSCYDTTSSILIEQYWTCQTRLTNRWAVIVDRYDTNYQWSFHSLHYICFYPSRFFSPPSLTTCVTADHVFPFIWQFVYLNICSVSKVWYRDHMHQMNNDYSQRSGRLMPSFC